MASIGPELNHAGVRALPVRYGITSCQKVIWLE
jgi:hypothetical protein